MNKIIKKILGIIIVCIPFLGLGYWGSISGDKPWYYMFYVLLIPVGVSLGIALLIYIIWYGMSLIMDK